MNITEHLIEHAAIGVSLGGNSSSVPLSLTSASGNGSVAAGATDYTKLNANPARKKLAITNTHASAVLRVQVGGVAYSGGNYFGYSIAPGGNLEITDVRQDIHIASATAGATYSLSEYESSLRTVGVNQTYATISAAISAAVTGDTIVIYPGVYIETVVCNKNLNWLLPNAGTVEIRAPTNPMTAHVVSDAGAGAKITCRGSPEAVLLIYGETSSGAYACLSLNNASEFYDVLVVTAGKTGEAGIRVQSAVTPIIQRWISCHNPTAYLSYANSSGLDCRSAWIVGAINGVSISNTAQATFKNVAFIGTQTYQSYSNSTNLLTLQNMVAVGSAVNQFYAQGTSTTVIEDAIIYQTPNQVGTGFSETDVVKGAAVITPWLAGPRQAGHDNGGSISLVWDDGISLPGFEAACAIADLYNIKMSLAVVNSQMTTDYWNRLQTLVDNGHGAISHTQYHNNLGTLNAIWFKYNGSGTNPVVSFNGTHITATCDGAVDAISFAIAGYTLVGDLATAFHAAHGGANKWWMQTIDVNQVRKGYTATLLPSGAVGTYDYCALGPVSTLAQFTNQPCSTTYVMLMSKTAYLTAVLKDSITDLNAHTGLSAASFIYPGHYDVIAGGFDADFEALGFLGGGGGGSGGALIGNQETQPPIGVRIFNTLRTALDNQFNGATLADRRAQVHAYCQRVIATGSRACLYTHQNFFGDVAGMLEAIHESGVKIELYDDQIRNIRRDWVRSSTLGYPVYSLPVLDYARQQVSAVKAHKVHPLFQGKSSGDAKGSSLDIQARPRSPVTAIGPMER